MEYNIHPIVVHFPVALLVLVALVQILPVRKFFPKVAWSDIARFLLIVGFLGAIAANITGEIAREINDPFVDLVEAHENFAFATIVSFGLLVLGEIARFVSVKIQGKGFGGLESFVLKVAVFLTHRISQVMLSVVGLIALTITGLLGGVLTHGIGADPLAPLVLKLLGINY